MDINVFKQLVEKVIAPAMRSISGTEDMDNLIKALNEIAVVIQKLLDKMESDAE